MKGASNEDIGSQISLMPAKPRAWYINTLRKEVTRLLADFLAAVMFVFCNLNILFGTAD